MASEIVIVNEVHETVDNNLCKAQAIINLARVAVNPSPDWVQNSLWAADDLIEQSRDLIGKY